MYVTIAAAGQAVSIVRAASVYASRGNRSTSLERRCERAGATGAMGLDGPQEHHRHRKERQSVAACLPRGVEHKRRARRKEEERHPCGGAEPPMEPGGDDQNACQERDYAPQPKRDLGLAEDRCGRPHEDSDQLVAQFGTRQDLCGAGADEKQHGDASSCRRPLSRPIDLVAMSATRRRQ